MIEFDLDRTEGFDFDSDEYILWIQKVVDSEGFCVGKLVYVFVDDSTLLGMNQKYLGHDTYTDIITFDYTEEKALSGEIFISVDRLKENANRFEVSFFNELRRVMVHGVLHMMGYKDKTTADKSHMRGKEEEKIKMFHVEQ